MPLWVSVAVLLASAPPLRSSAAAGSMMIALAPVPATPLFRINVPPLACTVPPLLAGRGITVPKPKMVPVLVSVGASKVPAFSSMRPPLVSGFTLVKTRPSPMRSVPSLVVSVCESAVAPTWKTEPTPLNSTTVPAASCEMAVPRIVTVAPPPVAMAR